MRSSHIARLALLLTLAFHSLSLAQATRYSIQEILLRPTQWDRTWGVLNDNSVVVGSGFNGEPGCKAFQWKDGVVTWLPHYGFANSIAFDLNNSGVIVGEDVSRPVRWINGGENFLFGSDPDPDLNNQIRGAVHCINSSGNMAGWYSLTPVAPMIPFIGSSFPDFSSVGELTRFYGINDYNDAVGTIRVQGTYSRAFMYHSGLATLNSSAPQYIQSEALGINNLGQIVGYEETGGPSYQYNALLWDVSNPNPTIVAENAWACAINDNGEVVGVSFSTNSAVVFTDGHTVDLNTLIPDGSSVHLGAAADVNNKGEILCFGFGGSIPGGSLFLLTPSPAIIVRDAHNDTIPNVEFNLIKVANDPPSFTEDTLGSFTTDSRGCLGLTQVAVDTFSVDLNTGTKQLVAGDSLKIAKHVYSMPAAKHPIVLGTMYSVHLDNAHFAEDGHMYFDTLKDGGLEVVLNHTELRYNLLASVQWEATDTYLRSLEDNFRFMSDYLYDVTDGQVRLDTVYIWDDNAFRDQADVLVRASNLEWPTATVGGILNYRAGYINMPRMFLGDSTSMRNYTDMVYPLNLNASSSDYRAKAHEFGHYALGFFDEYMFHGVIPFLYWANDSLRCLPLTILNYGFMDHPYEKNGEMSSEMSGAFRYEMESCRNTNQWGVYGMSCWDHLERWVEAVPWGDDNLYVPILKPDLSDEDERVVTNPAVFFEGPNDDMNHLDYHVGYLMSFPNAPSPQATGYSDKHVTVTHANGGNNADVQLINDPGTGTETIINQGRTSDAAGAWVVGVKNASYKILAGKGGSGATVTPSPIRDLAEDETTDWLYGMAQSGGSGLSWVGNRYSANSAEDSITIELKKVQGYYPLICEAELLANGVRYGLMSVHSFSSDPTLELWPSYGGSYGQVFTSSASGYEAVVADSLGTGGSFTLWAVDDSAATFFVPTGYVAADISHDQPLIWLLGPEGQSEFKLDSTNESLSRALILSSPYPVIRTGLDPNAVQAGLAHSLSIYPDNPLTSTNQVIIRYDDADLKLGDSLLGDESTLAVYHWVDGSTGWVMIGGKVDTVDNAIYAPISETGVYAAFTTNIITGIEDDERGDILPYQFELSQNYPNPFNPMTTIEYSLPERAQVTIEIFNVLGQRVRTLVNDTKSSGSYRIEWNGSDDAGRPVSTGVYLYRFQAGDVVQTKKMLLIK
jgi:hypothetical protein